MITKILTIFLVWHAQGLRISERKVKLDAVQSCVAAYADKLDNIVPGLGKWMRAMNSTGKVTNSRSVVFGAGAGTTATRSLHAALHLLGMKGNHYMINEKWEKGILDIVHSVHAGEKCHNRYQRYNYSSLPDKVEYVLDTPTAEVFLHLFAAYPNAKFVLTTRPAHDWSFNRVHDHGHTALPVQEPCGDEHVRHHNRTDIEAMFNLHNELVRCVVPKERLLEFDVFADSEDRMRNLMQELADFVGIPIPEKKGKTDAHRFPGSRFKEVPEGEAIQSRVELLRDRENRALGPEMEYSYEEVGLLIQRLAKSGLELGYVE